MNNLPLARNEGIVIQELDKEVLIYDLNTHKAYNLNETSAVVYQACNGRTTFDELKRKHKLTDDIIFFALDELKKENLIEVDNSFISPFAGMSRREVIRKVGFASIIALPVISSLVAPTPTMAGSVCNTSATCTCTGISAVSSCPDINGDCIGQGPCTTCQVTAPCTFVEVIFVCPGTCA